MLVVRHDHALARRVKRGVSLREIARYPLIAREVGSGAREVIESALNQARQTPRIALEVAGVEAVKESVRAGLGVGYASALGMVHAGPTLVAVRVKAPERLYRDLTALVPGDEFCPGSARLFMDLAAAFA